MSNSIVRFFTGENKPNPQSTGRTHSHQSNELELAERRLRNFQLKGMQMSMDEVLTRMAIGQVVGINDLCQQVAGTDEDLAALLRGLQQIHAQRMASYLKGE